MSDLSEIFKKLDEIKELVKEHQVYKREREQTTEQPIEQPIEQVEEPIEQVDEEHDESDFKLVNLPIIQRKYTYGLKFEGPHIQKKLKLWSLEQKSTIIPPSIDLRNQYMPPIFDQGNLGSCTANGLSAAFSYQYNVEFKKLFIPSRLFIYYNERRIEGTVNSDSGAAISDGVKVLETLGTCSEDIWPYVISKFTVRPPTKACKTALRQKVTKASQVNATVNDFKTAISNSYPVVMGFAVPATVENIDSTGFMAPYDPTNPADQILGGHCTVAVGYDDDMTDGKGNTGYFIIRNSWSIQYGDKGYFYMPYSFFNSGLISDCWVLDLINK